MLIFHRCAADPIFHGDPELLAKIPQHKSLFFAPPGKGLPIGNLTSQFFANVYLNRLDRFVKHTLKCRHYLRYCDDFVLLSDSRDELFRWEAEIGAFLQRELQLELNANRRRLLPVSNGIDFLGYIVRRDYLLVRRRVVGNLRRKLEQYEQLLVQPMAERVRYLFERSTLDALSATLSSYLGHCNYAASYRLVASLWRRYPYLHEYFAFDPQRWRLVRRYVTPKTFISVRRQYTYFRLRFPGDVILFQVGSYIEFYRRDDAETAALLGLTPLTKTRRGARWGFPLRLLDGYLARLRAANRSVALITELAAWGAVKERGPLWRETFLPPDGTDTLMQW